MPWDIFMWRGCHKLTVKQAPLPYEVQGMIASEYTSKGAVLGFDKVFWGSFKDSR
jgi:hypothetical protein